MLDVICNGGECSDSMMVLMTMMMIFVMVMMVIPMIMVQMVGWR